MITSPSNSYTSHLTSIIHLLYIYYESECDMVKYFMSRLIYFHEPEVSENKAWEWNILPNHSDKYNKWFIPH